MTKRNQDYKKVLDQVIESIKSAPEDLNKSLESSSKKLDEAADMTKEEFERISGYVKSDLKEFSENYKKSKESLQDDPFYQVASETIWEGLLDITDRTQIEWFEAFQDIEHKGLYEVGDVVGLGALICEKCGHRREYTHPSEIEPCIECGNAAFTRVPLKP